MICPRPFVKGSVCPAECWTFAMLRNEVRLRGRDGDMSLERLDQRESNKLERQNLVGGRSVGREEVLCIHAWVNDPSNRLAQEWVINWEAGKIWIAGARR